MTTEENQLLERRSSLLHLKMQCKIARNMVKNLSSFIQANDLPIDINLEYKLEHSFAQELFEELGGVKLSQ
ncbi:hypothetical protein [Zunongwangia sp.]|uniref:hypothetical protein n=1 Tax=Zunongwangia sp. TaxID=1965325 RepID=UPI003AA87E7F